MKIKKPSITSLHPGTEAIGLAVGLSVEAVRAFAGLAGCPLVKGGRGLRFVSAEAFQSWFAALPEDVRRCPETGAVPCACPAAELEIAQKVELTWSGPDEAHALARKHRLEDLRARLAHWSSVDRVDRVAGVVRGADGLPRELRPW